MRASSEHDAKRPENPERNPPPSHALRSAAHGLAAISAELGTRTQVRPALGALPPDRRERLTAVAAELPSAGSAAVRARSPGRRRGCRSRRRPLLLPLLEGLRHPEPDAEPGALQRRATTLPALRHALRRAEHRLPLRVLLETAGELAVGGVLGQTLQRRLVLVLDGDGEVSHPDDGKP